jgi:acetate kinase
MTDDIPVMNAGSSSVKASLFGPGPGLLLSDHVEEIGPHPRASGRDGSGKPLFKDDLPNGGGPADHGAAVEYLVGRLRASRADGRIGAVGHRVLHGVCRATARVGVGGADR